MDYPRNNEENNLNTNPNSGRGENHVPPNESPNINNNNLGQERSFERVHPRYIRRENGPLHEIQNDSASYMINASPGRLNIGPAISSENTISNQNDTLDNISSSFENINSEFPCLSDNISAQPGSSSNEYQSRIVWKSLSSPARNRRSKKLATVNRSDTMPIGSLKSTCMNMAPSVIEGPSSNRIERPQPDNEPRYNSESDLVQIFYQDQSPEDSDSNQSLVTNGLRELTARSSLESARNNCREADGTNGLEEVLNLMSHDRLYVLSSGGLRSSPSDVQGTQPDNAAQSLDEYNLPQKWDTVKNQINLEKTTHSDPSPGRVSPKEQKKSLTDASDSSIKYLNQLKAARMLLPDYLPGPTPELEDPLNLKSIFSSETYDGNSEGIMITDEDLKAANVENVCPLDAQPLLESKEKKTKNGIWFYLNQICSNLGNTSEGFSTNFRIARSEIAMPRFPEWDNVNFNETYEDLFQEDEQLELIATRSEPLLKKNVRALLSHMRQVNIDYNERLEDNDSESLNQDQNVYYAFTASDRKGFGQACGAPLPPGPKKETGNKTDCEKNRNISNFNVQNLNLILQKLRTCGCGLAHCFGFHKRSEKYLGSLGQSRISARKAHGNKGDDTAPQDNRQGINTILPTVTTVVREEIIDIKDAHDEKKQRHCKCGGNKQLQISRKHESRHISDKRKHNDKFVIKKTGICENSSCPYMEKTKTGITSFDTEVREILREKPKHRELPLKGKKDKRHRLEKGKFKLKGFKAERKRGRGHKDRSKEGRGKVVDGDHVEEEHTNDDEDIAEGEEEDMSYDYYGCGDNNFQEWRLRDKLEDKLKLDCLLQQYFSLRIEYDSQNQNIMKIIQQKMDLFHQIRAVRNFKLTLSLCLGPLVCRVMYHRDVMKWATRGQFPSVFEILNFEFSSFMHLFLHEINELKREDYRSITVMLAIATHMSKTHDGLMLLLHNGHARSLVVNILRGLPYLTHFRLEAAKRAILLLLYNLCTDPYGLLLLQNEKSIMNEVENYVLSDLDYDKKVFGLKFLDLLTKRVLNRDILIRILPFVPKYAITSDSCDADFPEIRLLAAKVLRNIIKAKAKILLNEKMRLSSLDSRRRDYFPYEHCAFINKRLKKQAC
ncbi:uncharacterized protein LOC106661207 [Cimex lectularius]|uniref:Uncharacterized protein n=1 Tax=Cimex lectularius TaxID=79782 RepID=A0A8I6R725_CIMLE|nr:uncharacterized protein LOC106661207 [Cimex lectularius]